MPRGGSGKSDDFSPYKTADGRELKLLKSSKSSTGYLNVVKTHGKFYGKRKLDMVPGSKKMKRIGQANSAREAAIILAEYRDSPYELPNAPPRAPKPPITLTAEQKHENKFKQIEKDYNAWEEEGKLLLGRPTTKDILAVEDDEVPIDAVVWDVSPVSAM